MNISHVPKSHVKPSHVKSSGIFGRGDINQNIKSWCNTDIESGEPGENSRLSAEF